MSDDRTRINRLEREVAELRGLLRHMPVRVRSNPDITEVPTVTVTLDYDAAISVNKVIGFYGTAPYSYQVATNATQYKSFGYVIRNDADEGMVVVTHGLVTGTFTAGHNYVTTGGGLSTSTSGLTYRYMVLSAIDATTGFFMQPCAMFNDADARLADATVDDPASAPRGNWLRKESDDIIRPNGIYVNDLADAVITTPSTGQLLRYNGSEWANATIATPTYALDDLTDVTISSATANDVLRFNGSAWVDYTYGDLQHTVDATGWPNGRLFVGTGSGTEFGISGTSKLVIGGTAKIDMVASGAESAGTVRYATVKPSGGNIVFQDGGTTVATWVVTSTASSRAWNYDIDVGVSEGKKAIFGVGSATSHEIYKDSSTAKLFIKTAGASTTNIVVANSTVDILNCVSFSSSTPSSTFDSVTYIDAEFRANQDAILGGGAFNVGFFGDAGTGKTSVSNLGSMATTETADATYSTTEQDMLNNLKTDVTSLRTKVDALIDALQGYNLV